VPVATYAVVGTMGRGSEPHEPVIDEGLDVPKGGEVVPEASPA
jgi:hypothetical protein